MVKNDELIHLESKEFDDISTIFYFTINEPGKYRIELGVGLNKPLVCPFEVSAALTPLNEPMSELSSIELFPNPCNDKLTINLPSDNSYTAKITNSSGAIVYSVNSTYRKIEISTESLSPGIYYLEIIMGEKRRTKIFQKL